MFHLYNCFYHKLYCIKFIEKIFSLHINRAQHHLKFHLGLINICKYAHMRLWVLLYVFYILSFCYNNCNLLLKFYILLKVIKAKKSYSMHVHYTQRWAWYWFWKSNYFLYLKSWIFYLDLKEIHSWWFYYRLKIINVHGNFSIV